MLRWNVFQVAWRDFKTQLGGKAKFPETHTSNARQLGTAGRKRLTAMELTFRTCSRLAWIIAIEREVLHDLICRFGIVVSAPMWLNDAFRRAHERLTIAKPLGSFVPHAFVVRFMAPVAAVQNGTIHVPGVLLVDHTCVQTLKWPSRPYLKHEKKTLVSGYTSIAVVDPVLLRQAGGPGGGDSYVQKKFLRWEKIPKKTEAISQGNFRIRLKLSDIPDSGLIVWWDQRKAKTLKLYQFKTHI